MAVWPFTPVPNSIQAPSALDPMHTFTTDSGITLRRSQHSRPQRRYQLDYLGKTTAEWRIIRDFLQQMRGGVLPFEFVHVTATDAATYSSTTPVIVTMQHAYMTGQWVGVTSSVPHTALNALWPITRLSATTFSLVGSAAGGAGTCAVFAYLPRAVAILAEDEMASPTKLMGPESINTTRGRFSWSVLVEEVL